MNVEVEVTVRITEVTGEKLAEVTLTHKGDAGGNSRFLGPTVHEVLQAAADRVEGPAIQAVADHRNVVRILKLP
jgi:hypothetical protein